MSSHIPEAWIEVNLTPHATPDVGLLLDVVDPLVHIEFVDDIESWHYFWEPALRLRLRWSDPLQVPGLEERLAAVLDARAADGAFLAWFEGSHGARGVKHRGEADEYGPEVWDLIQKDWMNGSEVALRLLRLERENGFTGTEHRTPEAHWSRHVHLFTTQLLGSMSEYPWWDREIVHCLRQARGYLLSSGGTGRLDYPRMNALVSEALRLAAQSPAPGA